MGCSSNFIEKDYDFYRLERSWLSQHLLQHNRRLKPIGSMFKGRQQLKAANLIMKCKIFFHMGDSRKRLSGYVKTDRAEILYKYQMYDQSKFSKSLNDLKPQTISWSERLLYIFLRFWKWKKVLLKQLHTFPVATSPKKFSSLL